VTDPRWQAARRILAVRLDNLGDVLLATPAIHALKAALPDAELTLLTSPVGTQVGRLNPDLSRVITYEAPWIDPWQRLPHDSAREQAMISALRADRYDAAVIFTSYHQSPLPAAYACYLADIPLRLAASIDGPGSLLTTRHKHPERTMHEVERGLDLVSAIGIPPGDLDLVLEVPDGASRRIASWMRESPRPWVVVHAGCSMPARTYPWEQYAGVVERLVAQSGAQIILTGVADEVALIESIFNHLSPVAKRATRRVAGKLTFPDFCAVINAADLVITNNTGPMHVAAAVKTPVVALFALTNPPEQWHPWRVPHRLLNHDVPCRLCYSRVCPVGHECLRLVTPDDVVIAAADLLAEAAPSAARTKIRAATPLQHEPPRRIAVLRSLYLGDLLCATPALRALRAQFPGAEITLIGLPWAKEMVDRLPTIDRLSIFPGYPGLPEVPYDAAKTTEYVSSACGERFDLVVQMHGSGPASNDFVAALDACRSVGFARDHDDRLTIQLAWHDDEHEVLRWLRLVAALGAETTDTHLDFPLLRQDRERADALLGEVDRRSGSVIGLHLGAKDPARRWPVARFAALADRLTIETGSRVVLTGTAAERPLVDELARTVHVPTEILAGRTDLGALAAVIARLDLLITNDTGVSHLAAAVGTPSVILFGPTSPRRWAPLNRRLHHALDARVLTGYTDDGAAALARLPVDPVFAAARAQLALKRGRTAAIGLGDAFDTPATDSALEVLCGG
jgi:ADP-heptose:LPS heptosyltransferase